MLVKEVDIKKEFIDLKYLLLEKFHAIEELSLQEAEKRGYNIKDIVMSSRVATLIDNGQCTVSQLTHTLGISRQAAHKAVGNLVESGFVEMKEVCDSKKVKLIIPTPLGEKVFQDRKIIMQKIENDISTKIGKNNLKKLKELLMLDWR